MRDLIPFRQGDPKWGNVKLGTSGLTVASHGCYTTVVAAGLKSYYFKDTDPGRLALWLNQNSGYDAEGQIHWNAIQRLYPDCRLEGREWTTNVPNWRNLAGTLNPQTALDRIRAANRKGQVVGICVDLLPYNGVSPDHIVLAVETPDDPSLWTVMDPAFGDVQLFSKRYGDPLKGVMGYRILAGSPANFPPESNQSDRQAGIGIGLCVDPRYSKQDVLNVLMSV